MAEATAAKSKYEQYVVRKAGVVVRVGDDYVDQIPEYDVYAPVSATDTGPKVIFSNDLMANAKTKIEYGYVLGDQVVGGGDDLVQVHKHDYEEIFLFLGTDPQDTAKLGAEVEFWLGEGDARDKVVLTTSSAVYVPPNVAHFPQIWRNVTRPVLIMVVMPTVGERDLELVK
jgi:hypothetical protein